MRLENRLEFTKREEIETPVTEPKFGTFHENFNVIMRPCCIINSITSLSAAQRLSVNINKLREEHHRARLALHYTDQIHELKIAIHGLIGSMYPHQDLEAAARYAEQALRLSGDMIDGVFAKKMIPSPEVPEAPLKILNYAIDSLEASFSAEFNRAAEAGDFEKSTLFFKLFPLIQRYGAGIDAYMMYVRRCIEDKVRARQDTQQALDDPWYFSKAFKTLTFVVCRIISQHCVIVGQHYGHDGVAQMMTRIRNEYYHHGVLILDNWAKSRQIDKIVAKARAYPLSFVSLQASVTRISGRFREGVDLQAFQTANTECDSTISMQALDSLTNEIAEILHCWSLYKSQISLICQTYSAPNQDSELYASTTSMGDSRHRLLSTFNSLIAFYLRRAVEKAFELNSVTSCQDSLSDSYQDYGDFQIFSAVDDTLFVVGQVLAKGITTANPQALSGLLRTTSQVLVGDFLASITKTIFKENVSWLMNHNHVSLDDGRFVELSVVLNSLSTATSYLAQILGTKVDLEKSTGIGGVTNFDFAVGIPCGFTTAELKNSFESATNIPLRTGIDLVFDKFIQARLCIVIEENFVDLGLIQQSSISRNRAMEMEYAVNRADSEPNHFRNIFQAEWESIWKPLTTFFNRTILTRLLQVTIESLKNLLEKCIWDRGLGIDSSTALQLEQRIIDCREVATKGYGYQFHERFERCLELCAIIGMDEDEWRVAKMQGFETQYQTLELGDVLRARSLVK